MGAEARAGRASFIAWCLTAPPFDPDTKPCGAVVRLRNQVGVSHTLKDAQDFQRICDRMAERAERLTEKPEPSIGQDLPAGCPIIPTPKPVTGPVRFGGRTFTADEMNRAALEHRNREQARLVAEFLERAKRGKAAKPRTPPVKKRIIEAMTGADPLSGSAIARLVGGTKATVLKALGELFEAGLIERRKGPRRSYLWAAPTPPAGGHNGMVPPSGSIEATPLSRTIHCVDQNHTAMSPATVEPVEVVVVEGSTVEEMAQSIVAHVVAGRIDTFDFAVLLTKGVPEFVRAFEVMEAAA